MKKIFAMVFTLIICIMSMPLCFSSGERLNDNERLLNEDEAYNISNMLDRINEESGVDIVILTIGSLEGVSVKEYADNYYENNGFSEDGCLLLLSMNEREWYISTSGYMRDIISDEDIPYIADRFIPYISSAEYEKGFEVFLQTCDLYINNGFDTEYDSPYIYNNSSKKKEMSKYILYSIIIGFVGGLIPTFIMKMQLKSVAIKSDANEYIRPGSMNIGVKRDTFLYSTVSKTQKESSSNSSSSRSSHSSHGGGGGKF